MASTGSLANVLQQNDVFIKDFRDFKKGLEIDCLGDVNYLDKVIAMIKDTSKLIKCQAKEISELAKQNKELTARLDGYIVDKALKS